MRILYVSQYFPPEMGAPAARVFELAREWVRQGHDVTVLTGFPNHPAGRVPDPYRRLIRRGTTTETVDGIRVVRTWLYPSANRALVGRMLNFASFCFSAAIRGVILSAPDVVIGTSPQPLVALAACAIARRFGRPFVFEVRDLWPESLPAVGQAGAHSVLYHVVGILVRFLYRSAALIVPVSERFLPFIRAQAPATRIAVIENGVDPDLFSPAPGKNDLRRELGLEGNFVVTYAGTLGMAHGLHTIVEAAALQATDSNVMFLIVGDGAERTRLEAMTESRGVRNVRFVGEQRRTTLPDFIRASDVCLVLLKDRPLFQTVLPSKLLEFMACERAVIVGVEGLTRELVVRSGAGIAIAPESASALALAIERLRLNSVERESFGRNGREFVLRHFTRDRKAREYLDALARIG